MPRRARREREGNGGTNVSQPKYGTQTETNPEEEAYQTPPSRQSYTTNPVVLQQFRLCSPVPKGIMATGKFSSFDREGLESAAMRKRSMHDRIQPIVPSPPQIRTFKKRWRTASMHMELSR